ncbi:hypothetical protein AQUCO_00500558v1 [Aquilegia coerulea]|uniref:Neprosin PEP catalytic domain-containing protein n=1 Tax=Aquilegia coerulea TaxID=218851 RepID=A0A2G5ESH9_AQUCA|nr:hypothetical protein AQUCO_00500558v1 [Aquilegia coerulea]
MNIWKPQVEQGFDMFSLAQTWVTAGSGFELNTIEVGWMVSFSLLNDNNPRMFVYWTVSLKFYIKYQGIPVDYHLDHYISTYNGKQYYTRINVFKDTKSGFWYLFRNSLAIGYWPSSIFDKLNKKADEVDWGGEVYYDIDMCRRYKHTRNCPYPQMGSGHFPSEGYGKAAYMKELQVIDNRNMQYNPAKNCVLINDRPDIFRITQNQKGVQGLPDNHILFGGPGGYSRY